MRGNNDVFVVAVVLNYRTGIRAIKAVKSLLTVQGISKVILLDNDIIRDETLPINLDDEVEYVLSGENLGYAQGNNLGIRYALDRYDLTHILIVNSDIEVCEGQCLDSILSLLSDVPDCGIVVPMINEKSTGQFQSIYFKEYWLLEFLETLFPPLFLIRKFLIRSLRHKQRRIYRGMGSFLAVKISTFEAIGFFDSATFLGSEESILSEKLSRKKLNFYYTPDFKVVHDHGSSRRLVPSEFIRKEFLKSKLYYWKNYRGASEFALVVIKLTDYLKFAVNALIKRA